METQNNWGMVVLAGLFAIVASGVAGVTYFWESNPNPNQNNTPAQVAPVVTTADSRDDTDGDGLLNWQETLFGTDPTKADTDGDGTSDKDEVAMKADPTKTGVSTVKEYRAPKTFSTTDALARELYVDYTQLAAQGSFTAKERNDMLADIAKRNIETPILTQNITRADLHIKTDTPVETYTALTTIILREATKVKEYELAAFARTVNAGNVTGTPALKEAATLYANIGRALLVMEVPPTLADKHLALIKSVRALSSTVSLMGTWEGDPLDALSYMDAFNRAEGENQKSVSELFSLAATLLKKT